MESNGVGGLFLGRGVSRASKRAKERQNRSSDELVMAETRISRSQFLQVSDARKWTDVRSPDVRWARKSANLILLGGTGRPEGSGRLVLREGPDVW